MHCYSCHTHSQYALCASLKATFRAFKRKFSCSRDILKMSELMPLKRENYSQFGEIMVLFNLKLDCIPLISACWEIVHYNLYTGTLKQLYVDSLYAAEEHFDLYLDNHIYHKHDSLCQDVFACAD